MADTPKRRIRVTCEVNFAGCDIADAYYDLPDGWDGMTERQRDDYLSELAMEELSHHASSGASVVDENGEEVDE